VIFFADAKDAKIEASRKASAWVFPDASGRFKRGDVHRHGASAD
jgi:hypothetical protein